MVSKLIKKSSSVSKRTTQIRVVRKKLNKKCFKAKKMIVNKNNSTYPLHSTYVASFWSNRKAHPQLKRMIMTKINMTLSLQVHQEKI